jgi:hypothetical protein
MNAARSSSSQHRYNSDVLEPLSVRELSHVLQPLSAREPSRSLQPLTAHEPSRVFQHLAAHEPYHVLQPLSTASPLTLCCLTCSLTSVGLCYQFIFTSLLQLVFGFVGSVMSYAIST